MVKETSLSLLANWQITPKLNNQFDDITDMIL